MNRRLLATLVIVTFAGHRTTSRSSQGSAPIVGRAANQAANRHFLERWNDEEQWLPVETIIDGDLAVQRGTFTISGGPGRAIGIAVRRRSHIPSLLTEAPSCRRSSPLGRSRRA